MSKALKLVQKLKRREKSLKADHNGFDRYDKQSKIEEVISKSKGAFKLLKLIQRKLDKSFGLNGIADEPKLSMPALANIERVEIVPASGDFFIHLTLPAAVAEKAGVQPNDVVKFLSGELKGKYLKVMSVDNAGVDIYCEDVATYVGPESDKQVRLNVSDVKKSYV